MTTIFLRTSADSWINADKIEYINASGLAYTGGECRRAYQLIDNWQHPGNQIILGNSEESK